MSRMKSAVVPCLMVLVGLIWAITYMRSVVDNPRQDEAALSLIGPLLWIMVPLGLATVIDTAVQAHRGALTETHGLTDKRRLIYFAALALLLLALPWLGFLGAGLPFFAVTAWMLGMRRPAVLIPVTLGLGVLIWGGFSELLNVNLPLFPGFNG